MLSLDNIKLIEKIDKSRMADLLGRFSEHCAAAKKIGCEFDVPGSFRSGLKNVVCAGLGGSAIGADIIRSYLADESPVPIFVNRDYRLPAFVDSGSLVVVSSYSGDTEETISAYKDAKARCAKIIVITSGGSLREMAGRDGNPVISIPSGIPPRCAIMYSSIPLLVLLSGIGVVDDRSRDIDGVIDMARSFDKEKIGISVPLKKNVAKMAAKDLYKRFPVIYGAQSHVDAVVTRWKGQLAENSKALSSGNVFPEASHNEIVGWENPSKLLEKFTAVILRDARDNVRVSKRLDIMKKILKGGGVRVIEVNSEGEELLARMFSLIYIGDYVSFYLAILNGCDPTPVKRIQYLKKEMARS